MDGRRSPSRRRAAVTVAVADDGDGARHPPVTATADPPRPTGRRRLRRPHARRRRSGGSPTGSRRRAACALGRARPPARRSPASTGRHARPARRRVVGVPLSGEPRGQASRPAGRPRAGLPRPGSRAVANFGVAITSRAAGVGVSPAPCWRATSTGRSGTRRSPSISTRISRGFGDPRLVSGALRPAPGAYDIVFDSPTPASAGRFTFRFWIDDVRPPAVRLLTRTLGRGTDARRRDHGRGIRRRPRVSGRHDRRRTAPRALRGNAATVSSAGLAAASTVSSSRCPTTRRRGTTRTCRGSFRTRACSGGAPIGSTSVPALRAWHANFAMHAPAGTTQRRPFSSRSSTVGRQREVALDAGRELARRERRIRPRRPSARLAARPVARAPRLDAEAPVEPRPLRCDQHRDGHASRATDSQLTTRSLPAPGNPIQAVVARRAAPRAPARRRCSPLPGLPPARGAPASRRSRSRSGPMTVGGYGVVQSVLAAPSPTVDGYVVGMTAEVVDAAGQCPGPRRTSCSTTSSSRSSARPTPPAAAMRSASTRQARSGRLWLPLGYGYPNRRPTAGASSRC